MVFIISDDYVVNCLRFRDVAGCSCCDGGGGGGGGRSGSSSRSGSSGRSGRGGGWCNVAGAAGINGVDCGFFQGCFAIFSREGDGYF